jgi:hypothetical protein
MVQVAERWRPYRSLAVSYLFASECFSLGRKVPRTRLDQASPARSRPGAVSRRQVARGP